MTPQFKSALKIFAAISGVIFILGFLLPALFSAPSTFFVVTGWFILAVLVISIILTVSNWIEEDKDEI